MLDQILLCVKGNNIIRVNYIVNITPSMSRDQVLDETSMSRYQVLDEI